MHHDEQWESPTERQGLFNMSKHIYIAQYIDLKKKRVHIISGDIKGYMYSITRNRIVKYVFIK